MFGMNITVDRHLCERKFIRWVKSHKKARINKKWHKKYGYISRCEGHAYEVRGMGLVCCPCFHEQMKREIRLANHQEMITAPLPRPVTMSCF